MVHLAAFEMADILPEDLSQILIARIDTSRPNVEYYGSTYEALFPRFSFFLDAKEIREILQTDDVPKDVYTALYEKVVLSHLDPHVVYEELRHLAGTEPDFVLLNESNKGYVRKCLLKWFVDAGIPCVDDAADVQISNTEKPELVQQSLADFVGCT